jgi:hypothetical protein
MINHPTISHTAEVLRPTQVEVDLSRLTANYRAMQVHVARQVLSGYFHVTIHRVNKPS